MKRLFAALSLLSLGFLFPLPVIAGGGRCMMPGGPGGFLLFVLQPLFTVLLTILSFVIFTQITKKYGIKLAWWKKGLFIVVIGTLSLLPVNILYINVYAISQFDFLIKVIPYYLLLLFLLGMRKKEGLKMMLITIVSILVLEVVLSSIMYHQRKALFAFYKTAFGEAGTFYTHFKDECSYNYSYE